MGACEATPPTTHTRETSPQTRSFPPARSSAAAHLASSSFVLAAARLRALQLDPGHAAAVIKQPTGKSPDEDNTPSPVTTARSPGQTNPSLDRESPHGCTLLLCHPYTGAHDFELCLWPVELGDSNPWTLLAKEVDAPGGPAAAQVKSHAVAP
jgi:hypothetical protein